MPSTIGILAVNHDYDGRTVAEEFGIHTHGALLIGAGQVGGIIGGRLVRAGHDLILCDADREHVQAIRAAGLRVDLPNDSFTVKPQILFPSEVSGKFDLVMIAVRSEGTKDVLDAMAEYMTDDAVVVSLQNGMNLPLVADRVGADRAVGAVVRMRSIKIAPGHVRTYQNGYLYIGHIHGQTHGAAQCAARSARSGDADQDRR